MVCDNVSDIVVIGGEERRKDFPDFMKEQSEIGIAVENGCAIEFKDDSYKVLAKEDGGSAYRLYRKNDEVKKERLPEGQEIPLEELYEL
ncbi:MAG: hypothetical protein ACLFS3_03545 [Candidatus Aenigmatarchaeota archaeon]